MKPYGSDGSRVISTSGALTAEMLDQACNRMMDDGLQKQTVILTSPKLIKDIIEWQKREKYWKSLGPIGYKMEALRWRLKHRIKDNKVLQLPD
jgi:hypothetical protein